MNKNKVDIMVSLIGLSASFLSYAGTMGVVEAPTRNLYLTASANYNMFDVNRATTTSITNDSISALASSMQNRWGYGGGIGFIYCDQLRFDFITQARPNVHYSVTDTVPETARGTVDITSYMFNAYYTLPTLAYFNLSPFNLSPYFTVGIGPSMTSTSQIFWPDASVNQLEGGHRIINFAWQVGAGVSYALTDYLDLDFNYEFFGLNKFANNGFFTQLAPEGDSAAGQAAPTTFRRLYDNQLQIGVRYKFNGPY